MSKESNEAMKVNMQKGAVPIRESKAETFQRLARFRTQRILVSIETLYALSNTNNYEYAISEVDQMFTAMHDALDKAEDKFKSTSALENVGFAFAPKETED